MAVTIAFANHKGGVGKTTSVLNIGSALAGMCCNVLLVDIDGQHNLTQSFELDLPAPSTLYPALLNGSPLEPVKVSNFLDLIPGSIELVKAEVQLSTAFRREDKLKDALRPLQSQYDFILIDCPPHLGLLTVNAFVAADEIYVPMLCEYYSMTGYVVLRDALDAMGMTIDRVFFTRYDKRLNLHNEVIQAMRKNLGEKVLRSVIPTNIAVAEAVSVGEDIFTYQKKSAGAKAYADLAHEISELNNLF